VAGLVEDSSPSDGKGIFTIIEMVCYNNSDIKTFQKAFWLPKSSIKAALRLRDNIFANRVFGIPDEKCSKHVTFIIKNTEPTPIFNKIVSALKEIGVEVELKRE
jgi:hypothetical protein